jgi:hypothetical protein
MSPIEIKQKYERETKEIKREVQASELMDKGGKNAELGASEIGFKEIEDMVIKELEKHMEQKVTRNINFLIGGETFEFDGMILNPNKKIFIDVKYFPTLKSVLEYEAKMTSRNAKIFECLNQSRESVSLHFAFVFKSDVASRGEARNLLGKVMEGLWFTTSYEVMELEDLLLKYHNKNRITTRSN